MLPPYCLFRKYGFPPKSNSHMVISLVKRSAMDIVSLMILCMNLYSSANGLTHHDTKTTYTLNIRMPDAISLQSDALLCHATKLDKDEAYILRFDPHASRSVAHHMMVYGCGRPGSSAPYWSCAETADTNNRSACSDGERQILWAWAMDADGREFPKDVGFRVSGDTNINYIVIQLHYAEAFEAGHTDNSGVTLTMTKERQPYQAGYYVAYNYGAIPPMVEEFHIENACQLDKNYTMYPIAFRTHSHNLGVVTSGYRIRNDTWTEIGRMSPQLPQTFYDVTNPGIDLIAGDIVATRCTMRSHRKQFTVIGPRNQDEMCNFYIMYYTEYPGLLRITYCLRDERFHWSEYFKNIPETASSIGGVPSFVMKDPYADYQHNIM